MVVEDLDADLTIADGVTIRTAGVLTDALDVSDAEIVNAVNVGANAIAGTNFNVSAAGAIVGVGVNSGTGLLQGTGGLTLTGTTLINNSGTANTTIGNSAGGTITIGATTGSDLILNDAQWSVTGAGAATFASVTTGSGAITGGAGTFTTLTSSGN